MVEQNDDRLDLIEQRLDAIEQQKRVEQEGIRKAVREGREKMQEVFDRHEKLAAIPVETPRSIRDILLSVESLLNGEGPKLHALRRIGDYLERHDSHPPSTDEQLAEWNRLWNEYFKAK